MSTPEPHTDQHLFARIVQGDEQAFRLIFDRYSRELLPFVTRLTDSRELAREVLQDIFLYIWQQRHKLGTVENPRAWIVRLTSNTAVNYLRKRAADGRLFDRLRLQHGAVETPEVALAAKEMARRMEEAVKSLPPAQQQVYRLSREQHLSIPEIAERQGVSPNTVKNQLVAALKTIRRHLDKGVLLVLMIDMLFP